MFLHNKLLINTDSPEKRVALIENSNLVEIYMENKIEKSSVGDIYKGRVAKVLPGMQAAFVDIGLDKAAFLYVTDVVGGRIPSMIRLYLSDENEEHDDIDPAENLSYDLLENNYNNITVPRIEDLISAGQDILVQIAKDPIGTKGFRVTGYVTLPGRHLVHMPYVDHIGVSRKIADEEERERLRQIVENLKGSSSGGFIVRTVAEAQNEDKIASDMEYLQLLWKNILDKYNKTAAPSLIYTEVDLILRCVRDLFTPEIEECLVDSSEHYERVKEFVSDFMPKFIDKVKLYQGDIPLFDEFDLEPQIAQVLNNKVWLKSGGYLVFERTEALTTIDVNSGSYVGQRNLEETITQINIEAAREIPIQLRLRNIGGLIIIDFIDMINDSNKAKVEQIFEEALSQDRARHMILPISELGLMQLTRQRTRESLLNLMTKPCDYCKGRGFVRSEETICSNIIHSLISEGDTIASNKIKVSCHHQIATILAHEYQDWLDKLEKRFSKEIIVHSDDILHIEDFKILPD